MTNRMAYLLGSDPTWHTGDNYFISYIYLGPTELGFASTTIRVHFSCWVQFGTNWTRRHHRCSGRGGCHRNLLAILNIFQILACTSPACVTILPDKPCVGGTWIATCQAGPTRQTRSNFVVLNNDDVVYLCHDVKRVALIKPWLKPSRPNWIPPKEMMQHIHE